MYLITYLNHRSEFNALSVGFSVGDYRMNITLCWLLLSKERVPSLPVTC